jgi:hypothetical protein
LNLKLKEGEVKEMKESRKTLEASHERMKETLEQSLDTARQANATLSQELDDLKKLHGKLHRKTQGKTRSDKMIKYFSERISPAVYDLATKKEGFGIWKEQFMQSCFVAGENEMENLRRKLELGAALESEKLEAKLKEDANLERKLHLKTRSDILVKYFSEKVSPGIHDVSSKKESFGIWKEGLIHRDYLARELELKRLRAVMEGTSGGSGAEVKWNEKRQRERKAHLQNFNDTVIK